MGRHHMTPDGPVPFTPQEEAEANEREAAYFALEFQRKAEEIRRERNQLLIVCDWSQAADTPQAIKDKWAPYRQALRDVPQQAGFPDNIQWPTKPE